MNRSGLWLRLCTILPLILFVTFVGGCARQFTRERFELIQPGVDDREDVEALLGKPEFRAEDLWYYEDPDRHYAAQIIFDEQGKVASKEWIDARSGEWEGRSHYADEPPRGEVRERRTKVRRIDED
jgi:hypothetical protein